MKNSSRSVRGQKNKATHRKATRGARESAETSARSPIVSVIISSCKGGLIALGIGVLLIFVSAALASRSPDPSSLTLPLAAISLLLSAFFAGFISAKFKSSSHLLCGIFGGLVFLLTVMLFSLIFGSGQTPSYSQGASVIMHLASLLASVLGGISASFKIPQRRGIARRR